MSDDKKEFQNKTLEKMVDTPISTKNVIPDGVKYDIKEHIKKGILDNFTRRDIILSLEYLLNENGILIGDPEKDPNNRTIKESTLLYLYRTVKKEIFTFQEKEIENERNDFLTSMKIVAEKCLHDKDYTNYIRARKEIATLVGVFTKDEDSKITINFLPAEEKVIEVKVDKDDNSSE